MRIVFLILTYLWTLLVFVAAKAAFMLSCRDGHPFAAGDMADVVVHGMSLDMSTALYILAVPFLVTMVSVWTGWRRWLGVVLKAYFAVVAAALSLAFVADTSLYPFWGFKLDSSCLQYLATPTEAMASVSSGYLLVRLLALVAVAAAVFCGYVPSLRFLRPSLNARQKAGYSVAGLLAVPLIVIGIRGGTGESTTNVGQVYYSDNQFLNHAAVNPVFSFLSTLGSSTGDIVTYSFMADGESERIVSEYYDTRSTGGDTLLTASNPNVVIILLESCGGEFTEIGGRHDIMPRLDSIAHEGVYFTNCYANSWRTDRGTVCTWSGYPSFPSMSVMKMPSKTRNMPNIARSLKEQRGYETVYLYGGDINFTNMRGYLISGGFDSLVWKNNYSDEEQRTARWGVRDDITFGTLYDILDSRGARKGDGRKPLLVGFSTLSSHEPWDVPVKKTIDPIANAFGYLDDCIATFIDRLRTSDLWDNTLVVMLPDHGMFYIGIDDYSRLKNHIPMVWTGGAVKRPYRIDAVCNQTDLAATLLGQLGVSHDEYRFSRDVTSTTYTKPFAIHTFTDALEMLDSASFIIYDLNAGKAVVEEGVKNDRLLHRGKAILQAAAKDLEKR